MNNYLARLAMRTRQVGSVLCLGVDPQPETLPEGFPATLKGIERFCEVLIDAALPHVAAVKPNLAFFEAFGSGGVAALERLRGRVPADVLFVADAKRGDIGSTAARQAVALYDILGADAITANPYLGSEAIEPLLARGDRFAYVLCRTSNPGAGELQGLEVTADAALEAPAEPLYARVARRAVAWGPGGTIGLVVGATAPLELERIRGIAPGLALLVPGVGAQGGEVGPVLQFGPAVGAPAGGRPGGGLLVNVSRGISSAAGKPIGALVAAARTGSATDGSGPVLGAGQGEAADAAETVSGAGSTRGAAATTDLAEQLALAAQEWSLRLRVAV
jgi:orotidine 5'-phosphate decarboxylase subfamily 2